ncbi:thioesterase domain-containing protein, partial [Pontimicrobium sp. MEBiC01747]
GKTDRKQLETLSLEVESTTQYVAPETAVEQQLAILWSKLLELEEGTIGKHDNFFELGGHSLLTVQLVQGINNLFKNKKIELVDLINNRTIYEQAILLEELNVEVGSKHIINFNALEKTATDAIDTFIIPGMPGIVDGYYELAEAFSKKGSNTYGIQMYGLLEGEEAYTTIEEMAAHNIRVIQSTPSKNIRLVAHSYGGVVVFEMIKQLLAKSITITEVILLDSYLPKKSLKVKEKMHIFISTIVTILNIKVSKKETTELVGKAIKKAKNDRESFIYNTLKNKGGKLEKAFFSRLYKVCYNALSISYNLEGQLSIEAVFVKVKQVQNKDTQTSQDWSPYFNTLQIIESSGSHFEMVKKPYVEKWKKNLTS